MVTDEQYKALLRRIDELERKLLNVATQVNTMVMKGDLRIASHIGNERRIGTRDKTRYMFCGERLCKRRLVLAVVKKYIADNDVKSYSELINIFPDRLQGALGVVSPIETAERYKDADKRFYFSGTDAILFDGKLFVVCSQWDAKNISNFLAVAKKFYQIETI